MVSTLRPLARLGGLIAVLTALTAGLPASATAGTYEVEACDFADDGGSSPWKTQEEDELTADKFCPSDGDLDRGLLTRAEKAESREGSASIRFDAPTGDAQLKELIATLKTRRPGPGYGVGIRDENGTYRFGCPPDQTCLDDDTGGGPGGSRRTISLDGVRRVEVITECRKNGGCGGTQDNFAFAALYGATVVVEEKTSPTVTATGGSLGPFGRPVQSGRASLLFDASDGVGIRSARLVVDDVEKDADEYDCDYTEARPCEDQQDRELSFDTAAVPDGGHTARLIVVDTAGNEAEYVKTFTVQNEGRGAGGSDGGGSGGGGGNSGGGGSGGSGGPGGNGSGSSSTTTGAVPAPLGALGVVGDSATMRTSRRVVYNGRVLGFLGSVRDGGQPSVGKLVAIQARVGRRWVTFKVVRTDGLGNFRAMYRFKRTFRTRRYAFRAHAAAQESLGTVDSPMRVVTVRAR